MEDDEEAKGLMYYHTITMMIIPSPLPYVKHSYGNGMVNSSGHGIVMV